MLFKSFKVLKRNGAYTDTLRREEAKCNFCLGPPQITFFIKEKKALAKVVKINFLGILNICNSSNACSSKRVKFQYE